MISIIMVARSDTRSLTQVARALGQPQHRLIYLCEHNVVQPEHQDARGRGSSRLFSDRNLMEFAIALRLRELQIPVAAVRDLLRALRSFERSAKARKPTFELPGSLRKPDPLDLRVVIGDGRSLFVTARAGGRTEGRELAVFGPVDLQGVDGGERALAALEEIRTPLGPDSIGPEGSRHWRLEVSVTSIARDLPLNE